MSIPAPAASPQPTISQQDRANYCPQKLDECLAKLQNYFDKSAAGRLGWRRKNLGYHKQLAQIYKYYVPPDSSVLELGCGTGELLAALKPSRGVGIDLSHEMISIARENFPRLRFEAVAAEKCVLHETFDYIVLSNLVEFSFDILILFKALKPWCHARTRIVINMHSRLWQPILTIAEKWGFKYRQPVLNWVTSEDVTNLLNLAGFETVQRDSRILCPKRIPLLASLLNSGFAPFKPFAWFCLTNWIVARLPMASAGQSEDGVSRKPSVSVICPCRNEAGNIAHIVNRLPAMGSHTELIFVEGNSKDETFAACLDAKARHPERDISVYKQTGKGKKDAVWLGFDKAKGDILMILDADISVLPEDLPAFYETIASGGGEFINGSRLVYPMDDKAMRFLNLLGNKFFSLAFSYLLGQHVKDTLCGTKVLLRSDYLRMVAGRAYFGDFDPFGDFDLLFGAAKLGLKIAELPVRYHERTYGETQISRFRHGWMLLKMCGLGLARIKMRV